MKYPAHPRCEGCTQDLIRDCPETLIATGQYPCLVLTLKRVASAAEQSVLDPTHLLALLKEGVSLISILEFVEWRLRHSSMPSRVRVAAHTGS
jgi:hypothetical protein